MAEVKWVLENPEDFGHFSIKSARIDGEMLFVDYGDGNGEWLHGSFKNPKSAFSYRRGSGAKWRKEEG